MIPSILKIAATLLLIAGWFWGLGPVAMSSPHPDVALGWGLVSLLIGAVSAAWAIQRFNFQQSSKGGRHAR